MTSEVAQIRVATTAPLVLGAGRMVTTPPSSSDVDTNRSRSTPARLGSNR